METGRSLDAHPRRHKGLGPRFRGDERVGDGWTCRWIVPMPGIADPMQRQGSGALIARLKSRAQFLAAAKGSSLGRGAVVVQMLHRGDGLPHLGEGFTATKKIGDAVARNRAKRRLREASRALLPLHGVPGRDYVFIARMGAGERPWARLLDDVGSALIGLAAGRDEPRPPRRPKGAPRRLASKPSATTRVPPAEPSSPDG